MPSQPQEHPSPGNGWSVEMPQPGTSAALRIGVAFAQYLKLTELPSLKHLMVARAAGNREWGGVVRQMAGLQGGSPAQAREPAAGGRVGCSGARPRIAGRARTSRRRARSCRCQPICTGP